MGTLSARKLRRTLVTTGVHLTPSEYRRAKKESKPLAVHNRRSTYKRVRKILIHQLDLKARQERRDKKRQQRKD